jgi:hypothetical protein
MKIVATFVCFLLGISSIALGQGNSPNPPNLPGSPGAIFVPLPICRILNTLGEPAENAPQGARPVDLRSTRCGRIVPSYAIGYAVRTVSYNRNVPDHASSAAGRTERQITLPAQANVPLNFNVTPNEDLAVDVYGYFVAPGTPLGPAGNALPSNGNVTAASTQGPHAEALGRPVAQYVTTGDKGEIYLDASVLSGSGVLMTAPNANSPWITAKLRSADGSAGFAVANSANSNLLTARSDGAVQLLNGAFLDGRTDYFGAAGTYYGFVAIPTNIVHDVTLIDPHDSTGGTTNRVVFYNAQSDSEYGSPNVTKYRAFTEGWDRHPHINFDSQIAFHFPESQLYHFRAFSSFEGKDTFWVRPQTAGTYNSNTTADMYVSGKVGIGTTEPKTAVNIVGPFDNSASKSGINANKGLTISSSAAGTSNYAVGTEFGIVFGATNGVLYNSNANNFPVAGIMAIPTAVNTAVGGDLVFQTHTHNDPTLLERVRVTAAGDVGIGIAGIGVTNPDARLEVVGTGHFTGDVTVGGVIYAKYQDVAEWVPSEGAMPAGTVVILNRLKTNAVTPSTKAYDTAVAGVVSDQPGVLLGVGGENKAKIATTGRVKVRVDARTHAVHIGDLLVTSDIPGTAMLSEPLDLGGVKIHRPGTLIGKALEPLASGEGEILVLLSLQ